MKKTAILFGIMLSLSFTSCTNGSNEQVATDVDSMAVDTMLVDSIPSDSTVVDSTLIQ